MTKTMFIVHYALLCYVLHAVMLCNVCVSVVDVVVRAHFYKYFHPKEALVSNGVLNRC